MEITEHAMRHAARQLRPEITDAQFRLMWVGFLRERRRRERSRLYRWWGNLRCWLRLM